MALAAGKADKSDTCTFGSVLHAAAKLGHTKKLKRILTKGINVDYPNSSGQTPLFSACYHGQFSTALTLLKHGANPNEKSMDGDTPVHAACYSCNVKIVSKLLASGGDLRLHDNLGRTPRDWIMLQSEPKKKYRMIDFIEKTRYFAMSGHSKESFKAGSSSILERASEHTSSVIRFVRSKLKGDSASLHSGDVRSVQSMGFGKVYLDSESWQGMISIVPLVGENCLRHDNKGLTFNNGAFMVMESMTWIDTEVTVKRLHRKPQEGAHVDLLISESEYMGKIHHPNVLLFMGICQTNNLDGLVLLYERIGCGSLFHHLHDRFEVLSYENLIVLLLQICNALVFIHRQNLIHCTVSSHAINLITPSYAKLGNFEYMVESSNSSIQKKSLANSNTLPNSVYNWLAPELMEDHSPVTMSDMYGFCMVMYEVFEDRIPWEDCTAEFIRQKIVVEGYSISCKLPSIPKLFQVVLELGLQFEPSERKLTFDQLQHLLVTLSKRENSKTQPDNDDENTELTAVSPVHNSLESNNASEQITKEIPTEDLQEISLPSESVTIPDIYHIQCDKSANNSSSDFTQNDDANSLEIPTGCNQGDTDETSSNKKSQARKSKAMRTSSYRLHRNKSGNVDMYRDKDDTFHYAVCLSRKSSEVHPSTRSSTGSPSTLPRYKKPSNQGSVHKELDFQPNRGYNFLAAAGESSVANEKCPDGDKSTGQASHYSSLPSVNTYQHDSKSSPSALYKAVAVSKQPVEIVRDIKTELAKSREKKGEGLFPCPFRTPVHGGFTRSARQDSSPIKINYSSLGSSSQVILKRAVKPASHGAEVWQCRPAASMQPASSAIIPSIKASLSPQQNRSSVTNGTEIMPTDKGEREESNVENKQSDTRWFGGLGSVKNLVKKYQAESDMHQNKQAILEGKLTNSPFKDCPSGMFRGTVLLCQPRYPAEEQEDRIEKNLSEPVSKTEPLMGNQTESERDINSTDSSESGEILAWVNYHLDRIKEEMQSECAEDLKTTGLTPSVSFPSDLDCRDNSGLSLQTSEADMKIEVLPNTESFSDNKLEIAFSNTTETTSAGALVPEEPESSTTLITTEKKSDPEEFYFDDVIQPSLLHAKHLKLQATSSLPDYTSNVTCTAQRGRTVSDDRQGGTQHRHIKNRVQGHDESHQKALIKASDQVAEPAPQLEVQNPQLANDDSFDGCTTTVSVRSSGKLPGKHTITHTETDHKTGKTETVSKGTVVAQKVRTQMYTE